MGATDGARPAEHLSARKCSKLGLNFWNDETRTFNHHVQDAETLMKAENKK